MSCNCHTSGPGCCMNQKFDHIRTDYTYWQFRELPAFDFTDYSEPKKVKKKRRKNIRSRYVENALPHRVV